MCGISGFIGNGVAFKYILKGLSMLQNRGYDSAGICSINKNIEFVINKYASTPTESALDILVKHNVDHGTNSIGIGHTRWATHGAKTDINSHPHFDHTGRIAIVHNGIIENFYALKKEIEELGIKLISQTDTEIIANLISIYFSQCHHMEEAIYMATSRLQGTWGIVVLSLDKPNNLYCARHGSPLLIGFGSDFYMVASEQSGFAGNVTNYICLDDGDVVVLRERDNKLSFETINKYNIRNITVCNNDYSYDPYPNWTLKEIEEQYVSSIRAISLGGRILDDNKVRLGGLEQHSDKLMAIDHLILLGCGTSYHAGLFSLSYFKNLCDFSTIQIFDGAEFTPNDIPKKGTVAAILLSQSGETKDLRRCIKIARDNNIFMIGVVNVVDSLIAREVNCGAYLNAGREVAVASTKAFTSQIIVLCMIAIFFAQLKGLNNNKREKYIKDLHQLAQDIKKTLSASKKICEDIANKLVDHEHCFILGKDNYKAIALEGSLKMKEIGYIHTEGFGMQSLRHGPYSLIEDNTPIIFIAPNDENILSVFSIVEEVSSRGALPIIITDKNNIDGQKYIIKVPHNETFSGILMNIPLQYISYFMAIKKGHNPDTPRNLAKVVSV